MGDPYEILKIKKKNTFLLLSRKQLRYAHVVNGINTKFKGNFIFLPFIRLSRKSSQLPRQKSALWFYLCLYKEP